MPRAKKEAWNYEGAIASIEQAIDDLETGELPLADVFDQFTQAVKQLQQCDQFLRQKQSEAQLLIETLGDEE
ncbi:MAG: exodeoxyribonuclease VII small subunit [Cyanobacteria bacterium J06626_23]